MITSRAVSTGFGDLGDDGVRPGWRARSNLVGDQTLRRRWARRAVLVAVWALASVFYLWTATSAGDQIHIDTPQSDYYNQLADGFLRGELSIPTVPPPALVHLPNPYDPSENAQWRLQFHDLSLYDGHLYLSWGPTPVLLAFIPWRVLGIGVIPQNLAALLFAIVGLGFVFALLDVIVSRFYERAPPVKVALAAVALSTSSLVPYLLRRVQVYEVAIACAYCCVAAGLFLLAAGLFARRWQRTLLGLGSLALGLSVGARFELAVTGLIVIAVAFTVDLRCRDDSLQRSHSSRVISVACVVVPFGAALIAVLVYNFARFHNPLQIGSAYQLAGFDPATTPYDQLAVTLLVLVGALVGLALSVTGPTDQMNLANQPAYQRLADAFSFIPTIVTKIEGRARVVRIIDPNAGYPSDLGDYGTYDAGTLRFTLLKTAEEIDIVAPDAGPYRLTTRLERTASAPQKGVITINVQIGSQLVQRPLGYGRPFVLDARLSEGLNRIWAWASFSGPQPAGAYLDIVNVYGLSVSRSG